MTHDKEPVAVLAAILIVVIAFAIFVFTSIIPRLQSLQSQVAGTAAPAVDTSGWQTYTNNQYGFSLQYPSNWTLSTSGLANTAPFVAIGNPLGGTKTYALQVFIENNSSLLDSGEFVHELLDADRAADAANAKSGSMSNTAPQTTPQYTSAKVLNVGAAGANGTSPYPAYELDHVFEFDHNAEQIYVAHGDEVLKFDFPVAEENPNLSLPVANNYIAHEIIDTLVFTN